jgi:acetolactate synthase I/III small subunit
LSRRRRRPKRRGHAAAAPPAAPPWGAMKASDDERRHTITVLVDNEPGVLARVIGLFSGRGYNIDSLTVAEVDRQRGLSRINIVTTGTEFVIEQIKSLLAKLVPVHRVQDLTVLGPHVERELALVKVTGDRERLIQALRIADFMHARLVDSTPGSLVFEATGTPDELDALIELVQPVEVSRAGIVAIGRGEIVLEARPAS